MPSTIVHCPSLPEFFNHMVPRYQSRSWRPFVADVDGWEWGRYSHAIEAINPDRARRRFESYVDPLEVKRVRAKLERKRDASIRFGVAKSGAGYHGERGDFCLVGGAIDGRHLTLFYRSLELIGGLAYDVVLIDTLGLMLGVKWRRVTFCASKANIFALKRNSNEKLFPKLRAIFAA